MPIPNDYREIIAALWSKTEQGALSWTDDGLHISVKIDLSKFSLWAGIDENSEEPFVAFGLYDTTGKVLDSWYLDESDPEYTDVFRLLRAAKRHANGVPALLKTLAKQIQMIKGEE